MTPDEIINEILRIQNEREPDTDPGDITIGIQDDSAMVEIHQLGRGMLAFGGSIQQALENALTTVQNNTYQLMPWAQS